MIQLRITKYNTQASVHYKGRHTGIILYNTRRRRRSHPIPNREKLTKLEANREPTEQFFRTKTVAFFLLVCSLQVRGLK